MQISAGHVEMGRARAEAGRPLTAREAMVLAVLARGRNTAEAAEDLGIPPDEVLGALRGAMVMLGARSKLEALVLALRAGLIELPL